MKKPQTQTPIKNTFKTCIKEFNLSEEIPYESLSFSEKMIIAVCYQMSVGGEIDFDMLEGVLDQENLEKLGRLYFSIYNFREG